MLTFPEFQARIQQLSMFPVNASAKYTGIEVDATYIKFHRSSRTEQREGSKLILKSDSDKERIELPKLFQVYLNFPKLNKLAVNKVLQPGMHYAAAQFFLKTVGLYDDKSNRITPA